jgi:hypothetical protein
MPRTSISMRSTQRIYDKTKKSIRKKKIVAEIKPTEKKIEPVKTLLPVARKVPTTVKEILWADLLKLPTNARIGYILHSTYKNKITGKQENIKCRSAFFKYVKSYYDKNRNLVYYVVVRSGKKNYNLYKEHTKYICIHTDLRSRSLIHAPFSRTGPIIQERRRIKSIA